MINWTILAPVLAALAGAAITGLVAEFRQVVQNRREAQRPVRRVLNRQLEIWHAVQRANPDHLLDAIAAGLARRFGGDPAVVRKALTANASVRPIIESLVRELLPTDIAPRYEAVIAELADVDPFLAFRLSGKSALTRYADALDRVAADGGDMTADPSWGAARAILHAEFQVRAVQVLHEDILDVAAMLGWRAKRRARRILRDARPADDPELDEMLDSLMTKLMAIAAAPSA